MWRGRTQRGSHRTPALLQATNLLLVDQMSNNEPQEEEHLEQLPEEELWRGELEIVKSEKRGAYKWKKQFGVIFSGGADSRVEVYQSYTAAAKTLHPAVDKVSRAKASLVFPLCGATIHEETDDKHETRVLTLEPGSQMNIASLRVRLDDKHRVGVDTTAADAAATALRIAIVSASPASRPNSGRSKSDSSVSSSLYWDQLIEEDAASRIQAAWRGWRSRRLWGQARAVVGRPASIHRTDRPWTGASVRSVSSAASVSSYLAWQEFLENHAATTIQACWRAWAVRRFASIADMVRRKR